MIIKRKQYSILENTIPYALSAAVLSIPVALGYLIYNHNQKRAKKLEEARKEAVRLSYQEKEEFMKKAIATIPEIEKLSKINNITEDFLNYAGHADGYTFVTLDDAYYDKSEVSNLVCVYVGDEYAFGFGYDIKNDKWYDESNGKEVSFDYIKKEILSEFHNPKNVQKIKNALR